IGVETIKYQSGWKSTVSNGILPISEKDYLTNEQAKHFEECLTEVINLKKPGAATGLYLCLHLGLTRQEVSALQFKDIDLRNRTVSVNKVTTKALRRINNNYAFEITPIEERIIPLPRFVFDLVNNIRDCYISPDSFIVYNKNGAQCQAIEYIRELDKINSEHEIAPKLDLKILRETFIVRCIKNGIDMPTVMKLLGVECVSDFWIRYGALYTTHSEDICKLDSYKVGTRQDRGEPEKMNLLILGAGGYGHTVKEIAEKIGIFDQIAFLDDNPSVPEAIDTCANASRYRSTFPCAYPAIGDCTRRAELIMFLEKERFQVPRIIHPSATLSPSSIIDSGVIIEANATVNAMAHIKKGCIISSNALIDRGALVSEAVHVDSSSTVAKDVTVPPLMKIASGTVYTGAKE
ncbi:MAG: tyrosine-type recombinase/integrase, partial [Eubacteriales bacterium]|nr:tyrosine-type recombinase/integrase [Eubacteriales bacterium]